MKKSIGGSIESAANGDYTVDVKAVLTEAWQLTLKSRISINLGIFFVLIFGMMVSYIASDFFGGIEQVFKEAQEGNGQALQMINIIVTIAVWPFIAGVEMMGVYHAINKPTQANMVFSFLSRGSWVALTALLTSVLISIGFELLIIPGILLAVMLSLTVPLVVEKKLSPVQAIVLSIKALRFKIVALLSIFIILFMSLIFLIFPMALLMTSSLAPLAIMVFLYGLSYLAPWYYNVKGVLYRDVYGIYVDEHEKNSTLTNSSSNDSEHNGSDDTFSA